MKRTELAFTALLLPLDFIAILCATYLAIHFRATFDILTTTETRTTSIGYSFLVWYFPLLIFFFSLQRLYVLFEIKHRVFQLFRIISASSSLAMILFVTVLIGRTPFVSLRFPVWSSWAYGSSLLTVVYLWMTSIIVFTAFRWLYRSIINTLFTRGIGRRRLLLVGNTHVSRTIQETVTRDKSLGYELIGVIKTANEDTQGLAIVGDFDDLHSIIRRVRPDQIIETDAELGYENVLSIIEWANEYHIDFTFAPNLFEVLATNVTVSNVGGVPLLDLRRTPLDGWGKILKRAVDILLSFALIVLLSPVMLLTALLIMLQDGGSVLFVDERISLNNPFKIYKFRSMVKNAKELEHDLRQKANERDDGPLFKMKNDPRVTRLGRFLRKSRLDELPQLFNVLKGDMSLVGPRPHFAYEIAQYEKHHKKVLAIKPGLVGLAQLSGSSDLSFEEEVRLDTYYIENWSLIKDIELILKTPFIIAFKDRSGV